MRFVRCRQLRSVRRSQSKYLQDNVGALDSEGAGQRAGQRELGSGSGAAGWLGCDEVRNLKVLSFAKSDQML